MASSARLPVFAALLGLVTGAAPPPAGAPVTPTSVLAAAPGADWARVDARDLLLIDLADGARIAVLLAPLLAPRHVANVRALARAHWFDGTTIERVQDNYVVQWGDGEGARPLPPGLASPLPAEYEGPAAAIPFRELPYRDAFASKVGFSGPFPVAREGDVAWMTHCYGIVGVGRGLAPDTGNGTELYAVIGHSPRALDRNIALVGRVVAGFEHMTALPRGTADLGFYADPGQRAPIARIRLAADLPPAERPAYEWLRPDSASFAAWVRVRANRHDDFFVRPAGAVDLCNAMPPVRPVPRG